MRTVTRNTQKIGRYYVTPSGAVFVVSADGLGRHWYDSVEEARRDHDDYGDRVVYLDEEPED